jgi:hypothetical protein
MASAIFDFSNAAGRQMDLCVFPPVKLFFESWKMANAGVGSKRPSPAETASLATAQAYLRLVTSATKPMTTGVEWHGITISIFIQLSLVFLNTQKDWLAGISTFISTVVNSIRFQETHIS